jgi:hypothetical protein
MGTGVGAAAQKAVIDVVNCFTSGPAARAPGHLLHAAPGLNRCYVCAVVGISVRQETYDIGLCLRCSSYHVGSNA